VLTGARLGTSPRMILTPERGEELHSQLQQRKQTMRTYIVTRAARRRGLAGLAALALPLGILAMSGSPAEAHAAPGSPIEVFIDTTGSSATADAIQNGFWGYEGGSPSDGTVAAPSFFDIDGSSLPALTGLFPNIGDVRVAFVDTSSDGATEHPVAATGQTVDQVFGAGGADVWFMDAGVGSSLSGNDNPNDGVAVVSTPAEYTNWFNAGQPVQGFDNNLVLHDADTDAVSAKPQGKSILDRWAAGDDISMVFYLSTGAAVNGKPVVKVGSDGHAITAYMPFTTVAKPGDASRTSAGYVDTAFGVPAVNTTTTLAATPASPQVAGTAISLDAHVAADTGTATGSVEFFDGPTSLGTHAVDGTGHAVLAGVNLAVGTHQLTATFTPAGAFSGSTTASQLAYQITAVPVVPTHVAAAAVPGADSAAPVALTATVTSDDTTCPTGPVVFKEGATVLETVPAPTSSPCVFAVNHAFATPGAHTVTAVFTPAGNYGISQNSVTFSLAAPAGVSTDDQTIVGTVPAGTITITTPYTDAAPLDLGDLHLTSDLSQYTANATFKQIHLLDTRAGAQPWAVTALAGALANGASSINGQNVGLTDLVVDNTGGFVQQPGLGTIAVVDNPAASPAKAPADAGSLGLGGTPKTVMSDTQGPADVQYQGTLTLNAPTTTQPGLYKGIITFTAS
jgi:hypothetical protein